MKFMRIISQNHLSLAFMIICLHKPNRGNYSFSRGFISNNMGVEKNRVGPDRWSVLDPECSDQRKLTAKSSAGAKGLFLVCSQVLRITPKLSCTRISCPAKPSAQVTCYSIRYHEVHEDHEWFQNLISLRALRLQPIRLFV